MRPWPRVRGLTLVELMITVAVAAILAAVAVPAYTDYVRRSRVPAALDALAAYYTRMEQRFQDLGQYGSGTCAVTVPTVANFTVACTTTGQAFTATATGSGPMAGYGYAINHLGTRTTVAHPKGLPGANCWSVRGAACDT